VLVQLQGGPGRCFEAYFATAGVGRNTIDAFEGRASVPNTTTTTSSSTTSTTSPVPICGNGAREFPEQCDDGNLVDGDCCSSLCMGEPVGQPCAEDGNVCTLDVCSGLGLCVHTPGHAGVTCRPSTNQCDATEQCSGVSSACPPDAPLPNGTTCDVSACETGETCTAGVCGGGVPLECPACESCAPSSGCVPTPAAVCRHTIEPERSQLLIKDRLPDETDKIVWKWSKGEETAPADFGTPVVDDDYALCVYDESTLDPALATGLSAPAAGACGGGACWRATSKGYKYVDPDLTPHGIRRMVLKAGGNGSSTITVKAKGVDIPMPVLPLGSVLRVQLRGNGECWEATYSPGGIKQNDVAGFQARSD
jgi:cysteine-rich repeat protein